jgi:hypothetical protein
MRNKPSLFGYTPSIPVAFTREQRDPHSPIGLWCPPNKITALSLCLAPTHTNISPVKPVGTLSCYRFPRPRI